eukprot:3519453-Amphidinium_carterae.1
MGILEEPEVAYLAILAASKYSKARKISYNHSGLDVSAWDKPAVLARINARISAGQHPEFTEPIHLRDLTGVISIACALATNLIDKDTAIEQEAIEKYACDGVDDGVEVVYDGVEVVYEKKRGRSG